MNTNSINKFILYCQKNQPQSQEAIKKFFQGVVGFPYDKELLLQAFLFFNVHEYFPSCIKLLLFEKSPIEDYTDEGKCDLVYLTAKGGIFLIETKYIDTESTGATAKTKRKNQRKKVFEQVVYLRDKFSKYHHNISFEHIECGVFTTDTILNDRVNTFNIMTKSISINSLEQWQQKNHKNVCDLRQMQ